jgi:hypothetical protein
MKKTEDNPDKNVLIGPGKFKPYPILEDEGKGLIMTGKEKLKYDKRKKGNS